MQAEDYTGARTLATVEHLGETFQIVRQRVNGKLWRKYVTLLHDGIVMANGGRENDPAEAAAEFKLKFEKVFTDRAVMLAGIQAMKHRAAGHCD